MTKSSILKLKAFTLLCASMYAIFDEAPYRRSKIMLSGFVGYLLAYVIVKRVFKFEHAISYKRCLSLTSSSMISALSAYAIFFDPENSGRSLIDGYQSLSSALAINLEIGMYIADLLTITNDQFAIFPLLVHHVLGVVFFSYASLRRISSIMICYGLLQEACNPLWYAHQLMYQARAYRVRKYQFVFFLNAIATVASYVIIRFLMVKPQSVIATYQVMFDCPTCTYLDIAYSFVCTVSLVGINTFNLIKLTQSVLKAFGEARSGGEGTSAKKAIKTK